MKRNPNILILLVVFLLTQACNSPGYRTLYDYQSVKTIAFDCERHVDQISTEIVEISADDVKTCLLDKNGKITWILFVFYDCGGGVEREVELHSDFSDKIDLHIISMNYDILRIKNLEMNINKPIFFIERIDNRMRKNKDIFVSKIFGIEPDKNITRVPNIFVYNGEIIKVGYRSEINAESIATLVNEYIN
ncbi:MAG: hypothetical protein ACK4UK_10015 [Flavobacterium sp.]